MKTIRIDVISRESIRHAIADLESVKREWQRKANLCCEMVAAALADQIQANLDAIPYTDDLKDIKTHQPVPRTTQSSPMAASAHGNKVYIDGAEVAFIEFGAGIYHNGAGQSNPLSQAVQFDTSIGSYGKGQGNKKYWFVAHNLISCGTPEYMPIYRAILAIQPQIPTMIRQVFV